MKKDQAISAVVSPEEVELPFDERLLDVLRHIACELAGIGDSLDELQLQHKSTLSHSTLSRSTSVRVTGYINTET
jgi:hypothetical protein